MSYDENDGPERDYVQEMKDETPEQDEPPEGYYGSDESDGEWREGECDHCFGGDENGVTATGPLGPLYCACFIGQGADEDECHCGPIPDEQLGQPCRMCS